MSEILQNRGVNMKLKKGFTFAELMMFFVVISIILSVLFAAFNPQRVLSEKTTKYKVSNVYDALDTAAFEIVNMGNGENNPFSSEKKSENATFKTLCEGIADYINNNETNCTKPLSNSVALMTNENLDFRNIKPNIVALNGTRIYFSDIIKNDIEEESTETDHPPIEFVMAYADISGDENPNKPHTIAYDPSGKTAPSVFAFAIISTGDAIPLGILEYNPKYLPVKIAYSTKSRDVLHPVTYSYRQAKNAAWGWYNEKDKSYEFKEQIPNTYNDYVKLILMSKKSQLYKFNEIGTFPEYYPTTKIQECIPEFENLTSYDICEIVAD